MYYIRRWEIKMHYDLCVCESDLQVRLWQPLELPPLLTRCCPSGWHSPHWGPWADAGNGAADEIRP